MKDRTPRAATWLLREGYVSRAILPVEELAIIRNKIAFKPSIIAEIKDKLVILCRKDLECDKVFEKMTKSLSR
ncbi:MAG TPA: hypothetical protein EYP08_01870 [Pyrodictiaceae archaeon]|nr:hypothetical protein [Pyrodictiaceae archaeon]